MLHNAAWGTARRETWLESKGRVALVTGAGRGIGREVAELLASRGARVMGVARNEQELAAVGLDYTVADLGTFEGCALAVSQTEERLGPIEIFVCNHGIGSAHERVIWEQDREIWDETMRINLDGPFHLSRLILKGMVERGYGRAVYTSSTAGEHAEHAGSAYSSSKHGLIGLMRSVAQDALMASPRMPYYPAGCARKWPSVRPARKRRSVALRRSRYGMNVLPCIRRVASPRPGKWPR